MLQRISKQTYISMKWKQSSLRELSRTTSNGKDSVCDRLARHRGIHPNKIFGMNRFRIFQCHKVHPGTSTAFQETLVRSESRSAHVYGTGLMVGVYLRKETDYSFLWHPKLTCAELSFTSCCTIRGLNATRS